jgi:hypothetical protein
MKSDTIFLIIYLLYIIIFIVLLIRYRKCSRRNIKEAFLIERQAISGGPNPLGCAGDHGDGADAHHHGSCGVTVCSYGQKMITGTDGIKSCNPCPSGEYNDNPSHDDPVCKRCGANATSTNGTSCICTGEYDRRFLYSPGGCSDSSPCKSGYPHTKATQDAEIYRAASIGEPDPNGHYDWDNFFNNIKDNNCYSDAQVRDKCNYYKDTAFRESVNPRTSVNPNGISDFFCARDCSDLLGDASIGAKADRYECGRDGRSAHEPYCHYKTDLGCRGK